MIKFTLLCMIFTLLGALGGYSFKKATMGSDSIFKIALSPFLYIGGGFYIGGALLNILLLKELKYTVVLPLTSITYVWTLIISYFFLKEKVTLKKIAGVVLIIGGAVLLATV